MFRRFLATPFLLVYALTDWEWPFMTAIWVLGLKGEFVPIRKGEDDI